MPEQLTTTDRLAAHGLGHRRPTAEDRDALGRGPMVEGHTIYVIETGELVGLATAWTMGIVLARLERGVGAYGSIAEQVRRALSQVACDHDWTDGPGPSLCVLCGGREGDDV